MKKDATQHAATEKTIWELLNTDLVTFESIKSLLQEFKAPQDSGKRSKSGRKGRRSRLKSARARVLTSAKNKQALIDRNLKTAVSSNLIPMDRVHDLLRDGEENGSQRIFFYLPRSKKVAAASGNGAAVCASIYGSNDPKRLGFPKLLEGWADEPIAVDFRYADRRWTAKWYWRQVRHVTLGRDIPDGEDEAGIAILKNRYQNIEERAVLVARWNSHTLEIRVPNSTNRNTLVAMVNKVWGLLTSGMQRSDFEDWNLEPASTRIIKDAAKHADMYDYGDTMLRDSAGGTSVFNGKPSEPTADETGQLHIPFAPEQKQAVDVILNHEENKSERLVVHWKKALDDGQKRKKKLAPLRTVLAAEDKNELSVGAKTTGKAIDYVIYRLRDFSA